MPLTDILLHVDEASSWPARAAAAVTLARAHEARIIGTAVRPPLPIMAMADGTTYGAVVELQQLNEQAVARAKARFEETMAAAGLEAGTEWRAADGDPAGAMGISARYADLTIVSQGDPKGEEGTAADFPGDLALASGRPVLVIPFKDAPTEFGRRVIVGWNGSREAARAVADAMEFLRAAEGVTVLTISESGIRETAGADLARYLTRQGVAAEVVTVGSGGMDAGQVLLHVARERGCDLIVVGCYGHSRLREAMLGGASRTLLRTTPLPLVLSH